MYLLTGPRGEGIQAQVDRGHQGLQELLSRARASFPTICATLEDHYRPGWPGSFDLSHFQVRVFINTLFLASDIIFL